MHPALAALTLSAAALLAGCDLLDLDSADKIAALREADGKAIGSACRHAGRAIEDCYALNPRAARPAMFAGWREMDEYMRENKLEAVLPVIATPGAAGRAAEAVPLAPAEDPPAPQAPPSKGKPLTS